MPSDISDNTFSVVKELPILMDYEFVVRCYLNNVEFKFLDIIISNMRTGGMSNKYILKSLRESFYIKQNYFGKKIIHYFELVFFYVYYKSNCGYSFFVNSKNDIDSENCNMKIKSSSLNSTIYLSQVSIKNNFNFYSHNTNSAIILPFCVGNYAESLHPGSK